MNVCLSPLYFYSVRCPYKKRVRPLHADIQAIFFRVGLCSGRSSCSAGIEIPAEWFGLRWRGGLLVEGFEVEEVGVVDDDGFGGTFGEIAFLGMGTDDVHDFIREAVFGG